VCIFFPVNGRVLIGSTDIRIDNPDDAICEEREIDYMLQSVRAVFPEIRIGREHILSRFCGVRPLPASDDGFTGRISRDHSCRFTPADAQQPWSVYSLIGGKWTTFRAFGEQVGDQILQQLGRPRIASSADRVIAGDAPAENESEAVLRTRLRNEAVVHLDDLLIRRTALGLYTRWSETRLAAVADLAARELGWSSERRDAEITRTRTILARVHGVTFTP